MITILFIIFGLITGSFFNVLIWRIPRGESIVWPASHCPQCNKQIRSWENIPLLSYIFLKGKCSSCSQKISPVYPLVELLTAIAAAALWVAFFNLSFDNLTWQSAPPVILQAFFLLLMIPISIIDIRHYIIPDQFTLPLIIAGLAISFFPGGITPLQSLLGTLGGGGILYLIGLLGTVLFKKGEAMGGGDIKLMAAAGAFWGIQASLSGIVFGALLGSVAGITMIIFRKLSSDHKIPFGPFLGAGLWVAVLAGENILNLYFNSVEKIINLLQLWSSPV